MTQGVESADCLIRAGHLHRFDGTRAAKDADTVAISGGRISAVGRYEDLSALVGSATHIVDDPQLVLLPAFHDTHNHLADTGSSLELVQLDRAETIGQVVNQLVERARRTSPGEWVVASGGWHESNLREQRLPTAVELDNASVDHPILVWRGGHVAVANSLALRMAGFDASTPDPAGGTVMRDSAGTPTGMVVEAGALAPFQAMLPRPDGAARIESIRRACTQYTAAGIGAVRDPALSVEDVLAYETAVDLGALSVRTRGLLLVPEAAELDVALEQLTHAREQIGPASDMYRTTGLKVIVDGGIEGAAMSSPYESDPDYRGHLLYDFEQLLSLTEFAVSHDWGIGCHVVGDRALDLVLDVFEATHARHPGLPRTRMTIEHGILANADQRARAARLGIGIAVQYPLLYALAANMVRYWGRARAEEAFPLRGWLDAGVEIAAGSDSYVAPFDPLLSIWGMVTRQTKVAGAMGASQAIDRHTAFSLYTNAAARFVDEAGSRGSLVPGHHADIVGFAIDPLACDIDDLPTLKPEFTMVGGRFVFTR